jgi:inner membrane protein
MNNVDEISPLESLSRRLRSSLPLRIFALASLAFSLQIPIGMLYGTIAERRERRSEATEDITRTWGRRQIVRGPFLVVPYVRRWTEKVTDDKQTKSIEREENGRRYVLPETLVVDGALATEVRRRGIFDVPLYVARIGLRGAIRLPERSAFPDDTAVIQWDRMTLAFGLSDPRALRENVTLEWGDASTALEAGVGAADVIDSGVHAVLRADPATAPGAFVTFAASMAFAGSEGIAVLPAGSDTDVRLTSSWPDPSFDGAYLPVARTVGADGFEASWKVLRLARKFPQSWASGDVKLGDLDGTLLGVRLLSPVDAYTTTERAVKYELLFITLTFGAFFLIEVLAKLRVHPVQYLLVGLALVLFYLLLLSLSEHVGFRSAYGVASLAIAGLVTGYSRSVLGSRSRTAAIAGVTTGLYLYLFILLQVQDYALVVGAIGLFVVLAVVMYLTRRIDWYQIAVPDLGGNPSAERAG